MRTSIPIYCHETGEYWSTTSAAAKELGVGFATLKRHLVEGKHQSIFSGLTLIECSDKFCDLCGILLTKQNRYIYKDHNYKTCIKCWRIKRRDKTIKLKYNIDAVEYDRMLAEQNGVCAICGKKERKHNQYGLLPLHIDHDHKTGEIRGLLCGACNIQLGWFENNKEKALAYLETPKWQK